MNNIKKGTGVLDELVKYKDGAIISSSVLSAFLVLAYKIIRILKHDDRKDAIVDEEAAWRSSITTECDKLRTINNKLVDDKITLVSELSQLRYENALLKQRISELVRGKNDQQ